MASRGAGTVLAERVFRVQRAFARLEGKVHGPGELARATGLDDSTVHRILRSGVEQDIFVRIGHGRYSLGSGVVQLAIYACAQPQDPHAVHSVLEKLRATTGGPVFFYVLVPFGTFQRLCADMAATDADLGDIGYAAEDLLSVARPLRSGAAGRAILAFCPPAVQRAALDVELPPYAGPGAITDWETLRASLADTRRLGFTVGHDEDLTGWNSCAAPVVWGQVVLGSVLLLRRIGQTPSMTGAMVVRTRQAARKLGSMFGAAAPSPFPAVRLP
ncbi:IclR family transcriptional regulator C-terminal domain-containing protein [Polymorphospora rubra]|uniref:IclR family transcriptional regulator n=1 Tax=Polymorphospora rubra TaxID=338584 RepID=UPI0033D7239B